MDDKTLKFILEHEREDTLSLSLKASKFPEVDMDLALKTIKARECVKTKIPYWYDYPSLSYPFPLALEQCSSQFTAIYKQRFVKKSFQIADLTGGLGVDSFFLAKACNRVDYFEQNALLCTSAKDNFDTLNQCNIFVFKQNTDVTFVENMNVDKYSLIFIDPARRGQQGERKYSLKECEPDFLSLKKGLFRASKRILLKASPMADITSMIELLPETKEVHIVGYRGECKELLFYMQRGYEGGKVSLFPVEISSTSSSPFSFTLEEERLCEIDYTPLNEPRFLYDPYKAFTKAGCFKLLSARYGLQKIAPSTHLYLSEKIVSDFPGRVFSIVETLDYNHATIKTISAKYPKASLLAKNFPLTTEQLRKKTKIGDGDKYYIFAVSDYSGSKKLYVTEKVPL